MDNEEKKPIDDEFLTYNGFNRPAQIMGVPLMVLLPILAFAIFGCFALVPFFGVYGLMPSGFSLLSIIVIRALTENDPNALKIIKLRFIYIFRKRFCSIYALRGSIDDGKN